MLPRDEQRLRKYGSIDLEVVWGTVKEDIPALESFCLRQLNDVSADA